MRTGGRSAACRDADRERGAAGGFEVLPLGMLVFVAGGLLLAGAWGVLDGRIAASAAAREGARAFVESGAGSLEQAWVEAERAAAEAIAGHGRDPARMQITSEGPLRFERCAPATVVVRYEVPTLALSWIGGGGTVTVTARHREVVDPFRDGVPASGPALAGAC